MRNITVSVDDDTYKRARIAAAERDTSVSALVQTFLAQLSSQETEAERLKRQEREIRNRIQDFSASPGSLAMTSIAGPADVSLSRHEYPPLLHQQESGGIPKRDRAIALLDDDSNVLSIQVLQEFYVQATRISRQDAISHELATGLIESWSRFQIQDMNLAVLKTALRIRQTHGFSFWDSAILAAALALGCQRVYTEDLTHGQIIDGLTVIDPFRN